MTPEQLETAIKQYIDDKGNLYAIMVTGPWGSGKTYYFKSKLSAKLEENECAFKLKRISLFGVSNASEFYSRCVQSCLLGSEDNTAKALVKEGVASAFSGLGSAIKKATGFNFSVSSETFFSLLTSRKSYLLVFDDFERCGIPYKDLLGIINNLVENESQKVILLCDETKIEKDSDYREFKEKLIWRTLSFNPNIESISLSVLKSVLDRFDKSLEIEKILTRVLQVYRCTNIRTIKKLDGVLDLVLNSGYPSAAEIDICQKKRCVA